MRKLGNIATLSAIKSDYPRALEYIGRALDIARRINSVGYYGQFLSQKLGYLGEVGDISGAKVVGEEALKVSRSSGNLSQLATLYSSLADIYLAAGEVDKAFELSCLAMELIRDHQMFEVYKENSYFTHNLLLEKLGRMEEATAYLKMAYEEIQDKIRNIKDPEERKGFLTKNKTIAAIVAKWESSHPKEK
jgi:tetratricopeptide (TPR) repeat protein